MDISALQLVSRFALPPNQLAYCGLDSATKAMYQCVTTGQCDSIRSEIRHFKGLFPYLSTIAEVLGKDLLDYEVVEAYWLGNDSLSQFKPEHYDLLVTNLAKQKLPDFFIDEIKARKPKIFTPLHLFNVLHIGVGQITGAVPYNMDSINNCMIRWGQVTTIDQKKQTLDVELQSLTVDKSQKYSLLSHPSTVSYQPEFISDVPAGDVVAVHWNQVVKILTPPEQHNLQYWTDHLLDQL